VLIAIVASSSGADVLAYLRTLVWPAVVLAALVLFRRPIIDLLRNVSLGEAGLPGGHMRFEQRDGGNFRSVVAENGEAGRPEAHNADDLLKLAGILLQAWDVQLRFIRDLGHATAGLSHPAAVNWFQDRVRERGLDDEDWQPEQLLGWVRDQQLISLTPDGNYVLSELGRRVVVLRDEVSIAPKVF
jgi:hypothetical protein